VNFTFNNNNNNNNNNTVYERSVFNSLVPMKNTA